MRPRFVAESDHVPRLKANRRILRALEKALYYAELKNCAVEDIHKDAMRVYLNTWVVGNLKAAIEDMCGVKKS